MFFCAEKPHAAPWSAPAGMEAVFTGFPRAMLAYGRRAMHSHIAHAFMEDEMARQDIDERPRGTGVRSERFQNSGARLAFLRKREAALPPIADARQLDLAAEVIAGAETVHDDSFLAFTGDKRLLFSDSGRSFLMFGVRGRAWIAMGPPVGLTEEAAALEARFIETARRGRGWPAFYAIDEASADRLRIHRMVPEKVGERAVIDLKTFSISGKGKKDIRNARNQAEKAGCRFAVVDPNPDLLAGLRRVSDAWLNRRGGVEKQFSLGRFDSDYLSRFRLATVFREEAPVAFASIWTHGRLVTMDLMRFADDNPGGGMDYLFTELALWSQREGFLELDLGLAPLAGLADQPSTVARLGAYVYARGGRFYGFEGLRAFKDKFDPTWEPAYICAANQWRAAAAAVAVAALTGGGVRQILRATRNADARRPPERPGKG